MYGYPLIWKSESISFVGNDTLYFNPKRIGQKHMIIWIAALVLFILMFMFEDPLVQLWRYISKEVINGCGTTCAKLNGKEFDTTDYSKAGFVYSDDIFFELSFGQLYKRNKQYKKDIQRYKIEKLKGVYKAKEIELYIDPYLTILQRNAKASTDRIMELVDIHEDMLLEEVPDYASMDEGQKVNALKDFYDKAVDIENSEKQIYYDKLDKEMHGRIMNEYKSYDLMDNEKYQRIEYLLSVMKETFGFDVDAMVADEPVADEEALGGQGSSRSKDTANRDEKNATIEMGIKPQHKGDRDQNTQSDFNIFSREGKRDKNMKQNQY